MVLVWGLQSPSQVERKMMSSNKQKTSEPKPKGLIAFMCVFLSSWNCPRTRQKIFVLSRGFQLSEGLLDKTKHALHAPENPPDGAFSHSSIIVGASVLSILITFRLLAHLTFSKRYMKQWESKSKKRCPRPIRSGVWVSAR